MAMRSFRGIDAIALSGLCRDARNATVTRERQERIRAHFEHVWFDVPSESRTAELALGDGGRVDGPNIGYQADGHG